MPAPNGDSSSVREPAVSPETLPATAPIAPQTGELSVFGQATVPEEPAGDRFPAELPPPSIPGYQIEGVLGRGGMGVVYKARQIKANRVVALKMIRDCSYTSLEQRVRIQIEVEAIARLQHTNIVQLYEIGEYNGLPYFSLEFCAGGSLDTPVTLRRQKGKVGPTRETAALLEKLARAMHYAHSRGVVHRD